MLVRDGTDPWESPQFTSLAGQRASAMPIGVHQGNFRMVLGPRGPPRTLEGDKLLLGGVLQVEKERVGEERERFGVWGQEEESRACLITEGVSL